MAVKLVSIKEYSEYWKISRTTTYSLIEKGIITRYETKDEPLLDVDQPPTGIKKFPTQRK